MPAGALLLRRIGVQEPCAAEEPPWRRHFHLHLVFASLLADDLHGKRQISMQRSGLGAIDASL